MQVISSIRGHLVTPVMAYLVGPLVRSKSSSTPKHRRCLLMHTDLADVDLALDAHSHQDALGFWPRRI